MKRIKVSNNFNLDEFVCKEVYDVFKERSIMFIRPEIIEAAQFIRTKTGLSTEINNWWNGGAYNESGLRDPLTKTGATYSAHKFGCGEDLKIGKLTSFEMYEIVMKYQSELMEIGITRMENPEFTKGKYRGWCHLDCFNVGDRSSILMVNP